MILANSCAIGNILFFLGTKAIGAQSYFLWAPNPPHQLSPQAAFATAPSPLLWLLAAGRRGPSSLTRCLTWLKTFRLQMWTTRRQLYLAWKSQLLQRGKLCSIPVLGNKLRELAKTWEQPNLKLKHKLTVLELNNGSF